MTLHSVCRVFTCARLQAFEPRVFDPTTASTAMVPSTIRGTTAEFAGFLDGTALEACAADCRHSCRRG